MLRPSFVSVPRVLRVALTRAPFALALALVAFTARAAEAPAGADEPLLHPRRDLDPRVDRPEPSRWPSPRRAPVWIAIDTSIRRAGGEGFGAMLFVGLPLDRLFLHESRAAAIGDDALKPHAKVDAPPPPPKLVTPPSTGPQPPIAIPQIVTPDAARAAVHAALRRARLADADARADALAARARQSAALPELRLRAVRTVDQGQTLSPTEYDPTRTTANGGSGFWLEARATWRLDRAIFADEEIAIERMRHERAEAQAKLTSLVLKLLFEWQRALAMADAAVTPEEALSARLKVIEAEAELDLLTDGWFVAWRTESTRPRAKAAAR